MNARLPILYLASETGEDDPAVHFLDNVGIGYRMVLVTADNQSADGEALPDDVSKDRLPLLEWDNSHRLSRFGVEELTEFLHERGIQFEDS